MLDHMYPQVAMKYTKKYGAQKVRVLTLVKNRGKGGAVKMVIMQKTPSPRALSEDGINISDEIC